MVRLLFLFAALCAAQPDPPPMPPGGDLPCSPPPAEGSADTVVSNPDGEGYYSLFDGKSFRGWWQSCFTLLSGPGVFRVDTAEKSIYAWWRADRGGVLMTNKKFGDYELVFDFWADYPFDGGIYHRSTPEGRSYETTLQLIAGGSIGGAWGNRGIVRNIQPWRMVSRSRIEAGRDPQDSWTRVTARDPNRNQYACPSGCQAADFARLWDTAGWNQIRIRFHGATPEVASSRRLHVQTFFRRLGSRPWVPLMHDSSFTDETDVKTLAAGHIGIEAQPLGFQRGRGAWFRNIKWKYPFIVESTRDSKLRLNSGGMVFIRGGVEGFLAESAEIRVRDLQGKTLAAFSAKAGAFRHQISGAHGMLLVEIRTRKGRFSRGLGVAL